jgi:hypothetical protein
MLRRLRLLARSAAAFAPLLVAGVVACASPTLPLPPPSLPTQMATADADYVSLRGDCGNAEDGALVITVNRGTDVPADRAIGGAVADNCGAWEAAIFAHKGDTIEISQQAGTTVSGKTIYVIQ